MNRIIGLDLGIASVGWSVLDIDPDGKNGRIVDAGVRKFSPPEVPKTRQSNASVHSGRKAKMRLTRRKRSRMHKLRKTLIEYGLLPKDLESSEAFSAYLEKIGKGSYSPWKLRSEALTRALSKEEMVVVLYHLVKHRGYKPNSRPGQEATSKDSDDGKIKKAILANAKLLEESGYQTIAQMIANTNSKHEKKRNGNGVYDNSIHRAEILRELSLISDVQGALGNPLATGLFEEICYLIDHQKPFMTRKLISSMRGKCQHYKECNRAAKMSYRVEYFRTLSDLNNLRILEGGSERSLSCEERKQVLEAVHNQATISYTKVRKLIGLTDEAIFKGLQYSKTVIDKATKRRVIEELTHQQTEKTVFAKMPGYHALKKAVIDNSELGETAWAEVASNMELLTRIGEALTVNYSFDECTKEIKKIKGLNPSLIPTLAAIDQSGFIQLSQEVLKRIIPHMEKGLTYGDVVHKLKLNNQRIDRRLEESATQVCLLPHIPQDATFNPSVMRTLTQARKVLNAIIRKHGSPNYIHIETARDFGKSPKVRGQMARDMKERREDNEARDTIIQAKIEELGYQGKINYKLRLKFRLYEEQQGRCIYSRKPISLNELFDEGYVEVDHGLPYSRSMDDSMSNKVLCLTAQNQEKENRTPYEWMMDRDPSGAEWEAFKAFVKSLPMHGAKKFKILNHKFAYEEADFLSRHLNSTRESTKFLSEFIRQNLQFKDPSVKMPVRNMSGSITAQLRYRWGLMKDREVDDLHHAIDACVVAATTPAIIQRITRHFQELECRHSKTGSDGTHYRNRTPAPWGDFRKDVMNYIYGTDAEPGQIFISLKSEASVKGPLHEETIRKGQPVNKMNVRGGHADNASMVRLDVYEKGGKYFYVPVYVHQVAAKERPMMACQSSKKEWLLMDKNYCFRFSLYKTDFVSIDLGKKGTHEGYFRMFNTSNFNTTLVDPYTGKNIEKAIGSAKNISKKTLSILGKIS